MRSALFALLKVVSLRQNRNNFLPRVSDNAAGETNSSFCLRCSFITGSSSCINLFVAATKSSSFSPERLLASDVTSGDVQLPLCPAEVSLCEESTLFKFPLICPTNFWFSSVASQRVPRPRLCRLVDETLAYRRPSRSGPRNLCVSQRVFHVGVLSFKPHSLRAGRCFFQRRFEHTVFRHRCSCRVGRVSRSLCLDHIHSFCFANFHD